MPYFYPKTWVANSILGDEGGNMITNITYLLVKLKGVLKFLMVILICEGVNLSV